MDDGAHVPPHQHTIVDAVRYCPLLGVRVLKIEVVQEAEAEEHAPSHQSFEDATLQKVTSKKSFLSYSLPESP